MSGAGPKRKRVAFQRLDTTADTYGNPTSGTWATFLTVWGRLREVGGREMVAGAGLEAAMMATVTVRSSTLTRAVTAADRMLIDSVEWNIRSIRNPDEQGGEIEFTCQREVAQ